MTTITGHHPLRHLDDERHPFPALVLALVAAAIVVLLVSVVPTVAGERAPSGTTPPASPQVLVDR